MPGGRFKGRFRFYGLLFRDGTPQARSIKQNLKLERSNHNEFKFYFHFIVLRTNQVALLDDVLPDDVLLDDVLLLE